MRRSDGDRLVQGARHAHRGRRAQHPAGKAGPGHPRLQHDDRCADLGRRHDRPDRLRRRRPELAVLPLSHLRDQSSATQPDLAAAMKNFPARRLAQRGVVLFIALIVLVAMSLAGVAMVRSVDTALGIAGNLAFKAATTQGTERGLQAAYTWLSANAAGTTLQNTSAASGYYSSLAADPNWFDLANWGGAVQVNAGTPD